MDTEQKPPADEGRLERGVGRPVPKRYEGGRIKGGFSLHDAENPELCRSRTSACPEPRCVDCCGVTDEIDVMECPHCGKQWHTSCTFDEDYS